MKIDKMNSNKDNYYMSVARLTANRSTCISKQVGCVLVNNKGRIIMTGYNGVPSGHKHCNQIFKKLDRKKHHEWSLINELHGEENTLSYCAKEGIKVDNSIMYITLAPCISCAKLIYTCGIKKVYYLEEYDMDISGIKFLKDNGIECVKIKSEISNRFFINNIIKDYER